MPCIRAEAPLPPAVTEERKDVVMLQTKENAVRSVGSIEQFMAERVLESWLGDPYMSSEENERTLTMLENGLILAGWGGGPCPLLSGPTLSP
jgi:hypothetical protein